MPIVEVSGLRKEFRVLAHKQGLSGALLNLFSARGKTVTAVDGISFAVEPGECVGYIGPNGAGKSTTIKMLTGILVPTAGAVSVCGITPHRDRKANARNIGVIFGQRTQLWWDLPPIEAFELLGKIYRIERETLRRRTGFFTELFQLGEFLHTPVRKLSLGQKMRCELAAALLHDPPVLFLDEPTIGLDIVAKDEVRNLLKTINAERKTTILLTSHDLDDIERLSTRIIIIDNGKIVHDGNMESLKGGYGDYRKIVVDLRDTARDIVLPAAAHVIGREGRRVHIEFDAAKIRAPELISSLLAAHDVHDLTVQESGIEDIIKRIYARGNASRGTT